MKQRDGGSLWTTPASNPPVPAWLRGQSRHSCGWVCYYFEGVGVSVAARQTSANSGSPGTVTVQQPPAATAADVPSLIPSLLTAGAIVAVACASAGPSETPTQLFVRNPIRCVIPEPHPLVLVQLCLTESQLHHTDPTWLQISLRAAAHPLDLLSPASPLRSPTRPRANQPRKLSVQVTQVLRPIVSFWSLNAGRKGQR